jgi:hypothetical protein
VGIRNTKYKAVGHGNLKDDYQKVCQAKGDRAEGDIWRKQIRFLPGRAIQHERRSTKSDDRLSSCLYLR